MFHTNGKAPAPPQQRGAGAAPQETTEFLPDLRAGSWPAVLYHLTRQQLLGVSLLRWIYAVLLVTVVGWVVGGLPGGSRVASLFAIALVGLVMSAQIAYKHTFVTFRETSFPSTPAHRLPPTSKIPVYATGSLAVDNKQRLFVALPGFYRTFATREHALLCQARTRRFALVATWPEDEEGLWYAFFRPEQVESLRTGMLEFGGTRLPALAVDYRAAPTLQGRKRARGPVAATLLLAFLQENDRQAVLADLIADQQVATRVGKKS